MMAVVEVDAGQEAKRGKATDEDGPRTPPPPPVEVARKPRQPTPDHPPYCWMIGEAIDALVEDGGSEEDSISAFIRARYPGVPPAHDRLLRHYLGKHVAEGFFVRTAAGRFQRSTEENADEELPVEQAEAGSCRPASVGSLVVEAKRGRGRPRKDGSPSTPPEGRKDGSAGAQWTMTPPAGCSSTLAVVAKDSVPISPVAVAGKDEVQAPSLKPKRRRRLRRVGMPKTAESSGEALVAGEKHGSEVPCTSDKEHEPPRELALMILGDNSSASTMDKACTEVPPTTPPVAVGGDQPLDLALLTTTEVPMSEPAPTPTPTPTPAMDQDGGQPLDLALVTTTEVPAPEPAPTPTPTPAMDKDGGQPLDLALLTTTEVPEPAPTPAMDKDGGDASSIVDKDGGICTTPTAPEPGSRACKLVPMAAAAAGFVPVLVDVREPRKVSSAPTAVKKARGKALSATPKGRRRQRKSAVVATGDRSALTPGKKVGCKVSFASPKSALVATGDSSALTPGKKVGCKVSFASSKLTPVIAGGRPTPASVADQGGMEASEALKPHGMEASEALKPHDQPCKLYPVTADEISDDPGIALLALPSQSLEVSNMQLQNLGT